jgi:hypothetical protein
MGRRGRPGVQIPFVIPIRVSDNAAVDLTSLPSALAALCLILVHRGPGLIGDVAAELVDVHYLGVVLQLVADDPVPARLVCYRFSVDVSEL